MFNNPVTRKALLWTFTLNKNEKSTLCVILKTVQNNIKVNDTFICTSEDLHFWMTMQIWGQFMFGVCMDECFNCLCPWFDVCKGIK